MAKKNLQQPALSAEPIPEKTLRQNAEDTLQQKHAGRAPVTPADAHRLLHELEVHQIELEMQNDELRRIQHELELSRERYFDLYDLAPVGYLTISKRGLILEANLRAATLLGVNRNHLGNQPLSYFSAPDSSDIFYLIIKKLFATGEPQTTELQMKNRNGEVFWAYLTATAAQAADGTATCRVMLSDITEIKRAEFAVRESEERYRTIMEQAGDAIYVHDGAGRILDVNRQVCRSLGYSREELLARSIEDIDPEAAQAGRHTLWGRVLDGEQFTFESRHTARDGRSIPVEKTLGSLRLPAGQAVLGIARDITVRKQAEEALEEKNAELLRFTYAASHDLRSPLVTIKTFLGHLVKDMASSDAERVAQDLDYINAAADKMDTLLEELQHLSKIGSKANPLVEATLQDIAKEALTLVAGRIDQRGVRVQVTQEPVLICGDRVRLVELFQNLVDNAVKFMGAQPEPVVEIGAELRDGQTVFFVRDNGMGIDLQHKDKIFGLFEKLDSTMEGTGIGLALVKRIVEIHHGRIWIESGGLGKGACFLFTLPKGAFQASK